MAIRFHKEQRKAKTIRFHKKYRKRRQLGFIQMIESEGD